MNQNEKPKLWWEKAAQAAQKTPAKGAGDDQRVQYRLTYRAGYVKGR